MIEHKLRGKEPHLKLTANKWCAEDLSLGLSDYQAWTHFASLYQVASEIGFITSSLALQATGTFLCAHLTSLDAGKATSLLPPLNRTLISWN